MQIGLLNDSVLELKELWLALMQDSSKNCPFCLHHDDRSHQQQSEMMSLALKQKDGELKKKEEEIVALQSEVDSTITSSPDFEGKKTYMASDSL